MSIAAPDIATGKSGADGEIIISADSHVMEPHDLWEKALSARFGEAAPKFKKLEVGEGFQHHPGGNDPHARIGEMAQDGVSAEVLYPTLGLSLFQLDDVALEQAVFQVYNDWLIEYCSVNTDRLVGVAAISVYDMDVAIKELRRCHAAGLKGAIIWEVPHPSLPFYAEHYNPLWQELQELDMPLSLHILTGHGYVKKRGLGGRDIESYRGSVNHKTYDAMNALFDFTFYGIFERYPGLKLVLVEHEIGWIPWLLQQWDYYYNRFKKSNPLPITMNPSEYYKRQAYATFFNDHVGTQTFAFWPDNNCMWSNDFPHENSTWPNSRKVIERDLGSLPAGTRAKLVRETVTGLYKMKVASHV
jgi:predicted TIM-barrel fold metal-dependent hydrolase